MLRKGDSLIGDQQVVKETRDAKQQKSKGSRKGLQRVEAYYQKAHTGHGGAIYDLGVNSGHVAKKNHIPQTGLERTKKGEAEGNIQVLNRSDNAFY